mmetsp:Transcript_16970/g.35454  ORF Transcript_16970/g.35454 Transcript_16970/m.35454 type:complete len:139 (-) Transcript_16970:166-582(-)
MALRSVARAMAQARSAAPARRNLSSIIDADSGKLATQGYHYTSMALIPLTPLAFVLSPSSYCLPVDLALGVVIPLHAHIGMNYVMTDYVKKFVGKAAVGPSRYIMLGATGITMAGLLKLNLSGPGVTESVKSLWRKKE